ncbi:MAG TPA: nickel pincer cofactor biosynthesis protein LarC [Vicinamibacterales bacterium]|nr:nickel pincer cofactor biosynthesis protein LarC [Vicinamibacterales bacterium]
MSRLLYFDCFSGISGDMVLGALLDAGLPLEELRRALGSLAIDGYTIEARTVLRAHVSATKFDVRERGAASDAAGQGHSRAHDHGATKPGHSHDHDHGHEPGQAHAGPHHPHRSLPEIFALVDRAALSAAARTRVRELFQRLAEAEAAIHQMPVETVHLHEVGALDSIVDIVGAVFGLEWFGADRIVVSPLNVGSGMVHSAHGVFPVPAPATLRLLGDAPVYSSGRQAELVTPTGALLAAGYADAFGPIPPMHIERIGYGAGGRDFAETPNVLRVLVGRPADARTAGERVLVIECEIDDMNPQIFGLVMDRLYEAGAWEVFYTPVQMKKSRPGTLVTVVAPPDRRELLSDLLFRETTTIGLRYTEVDRECLSREVVSVETPLGLIRFKVARRHGAIVNASPEFEDCAGLATRHAVPVKQVQAVAIAAWRDRNAS